MKLNMNQTAELIGVNRRTLERYVKDGKAPPYTKLPGGNYVFARQDVLDWLEIHKKYPTRMLRPTGPLVTRFYVHEDANGKWVQRILDRNPGIPVTRLAPKRACQGIQR